MKLQTESQKRKTTGNILDLAVLLCVMQFIAYRFLLSTMFSIVYSDAYKNATLVSLVLTGGARFLFILWQKKEADETILSMKNAAKVLAAVLLTLPLVYMGIKKDLKFLVFYPVIMVGLYEMEPERVLRWFAVTIGALVAAIVLCALSGTVRNLVHFENGRLTGAYGIKNTTDLASYAVFFVLAVWCSAKKGKWKTDAAMALLCLGVGGIMYYYTNSRTIIFCTGLTLIGIGFEAFSRKALEKDMKAGRRIRRVYRILTFAFLICTAVFVLMAILYKAQNPLAIRIDELTSGRLSVPLNSLEKNGIQLFGAGRTTSHGAGATLFPYWTVNGYGYIDVFYAQLVIRYGVILFLIFGFLWTWQADRAYRGGKYKMVLAMAIIAFHALSESRFLDANYNFFLLLPLCAYGIPKAEAARESLPDGSTEDSRNRKTVWIPAALAVLLAGIFFLLLPRMLSWLRSLFWLKGWNEGNQVIGSFLVCAGIILLLLGLWKTAGMLWLRRSGKNAVLLMGVIALITAGVLWTNAAINQGSESLKSRLEAEKPVLQTIQEAASQPVYAAEASELYQRTTGGFTDHLFSTEELYRGQGTIVTDGETEAMGATRMGAQYTQLSDWSGVYSFDPAVIGKLGEQGYTWTPFFSGERHGNLEEIARLNDLKLDEKGRIILEGKKHSINDNLTMDQTGAYTVRISLHLTEAEKASASGVLCTLYALGEGGEREILRKELTAGDFDGNGECQAELSYWIGDTPKVKYLVKAEESVRLLVSELTWRKTSD